MHYCELENEKVSVSKLFNKYKIILFTIENDLKKIDFIERINLLNRKKFRIIYN